MDKAKFREMLLEILKDDLSISIDTEQDYYQKNLVVKITMWDSATETEQIIAEDYIDMPGSETNDY